ncbi:putative pentatricopeptide repeat-containing protein At1g64310 [Olea europaea var. sylvestris]|uniref:Pentatricopeptide repeat-containing protein n=1 Tax=Olea europaea subsp. europaea TaxID=158383 RepID=A0A8S0S3E0_OLEEU|nr:putative pentatricopeptide repeat-containing protein At1g64310 [Olea europaea var. sylvestris]XP_022889885.1 putative pentatricopeptide repeat-containing protein At1g64310 [Olea europaea var. sylvestris]XP_022889886.1 putative pentatricopeptide repeat-containing protein At1g64310 [Olea europaea var. sylvestris]XP_022889887.1 putative pentatricopeptide repeat-containing protein At1g64310 [Olea europaea var. sylvestris]XP_022889888.1 putative pentatricopeptide repeat-containing protein At1g643
MRSHSGEFQHSACTKTNNFHVGSTYQMHIQLKALLSELSKLNQTLSRAKILHGLVIQNNLSRDSFYSTKIVRLYAINGDLVSARNLFDKSPQRSIYLWNAIIRAYAQAHKFSDAFMLFRRLLFSKTEPDNFTFACVLRACSEWRNIEGLRAVHGKVVVSGLGMEFICDSALVSAYSKVGNVDEASSVFYGIDEPDLVLWNTMISGYGCYGDFSKGLQLFSMMLEMGVSPDGYTVVGLITGLTDPSLIKFGEAIHGFCFKHSFVLNDHVGCVLVSMYSRFKCMDSACRVFYSLVRPDLVTWSSLITGLSQAGDSLKALYFFRKFIIDGGKADPVMIASVLAASAQLAVVGPGSEIHGHAVRNGYYMEIMVSTALIDMYAKCGFLELGIQVFETKTSTNIVMYNSIISCLGLYGRALEAFQMFNDMIVGGFSPDETTFCGLLSACCHAGLVSDGWEYFTMMKNEFGIKAKTEHYVYMVKLLGMAGELEEAYQLVKSIEQPVNSSIWGALLSCCDAHKNYKLGEVIAQHLFKNKAEISKYSVMLSNFYAGDESWDAVNQLRVEKGGDTRKIPGITWIGGTNY